MVKCCAAVNSLSTVGARSLAGASVQCTWSLQSVDRGRSWLLLTMTTQHAPAEVVGCIVESYISLEDCATC